MKKRLRYCMLMLFMVASSFISCEKPSEEDPRILQEKEDEAIYLQLRDDKSVSSTCWNIYCYARQIYYWNKNLPKLVDYDSEKYENLPEKDAVQALFTDIIKASKGADSWSYIKNIKTGKKITAGISSDNFTNTTSIGVLTIKKDSKQYCAYVNPGSPAATAGVKRGDRMIDSKDGKAIFLRNGRAPMTIPKDNSYREPNAQISSFEVKTLAKKIVKVGYLFFDEFNSPTFQKMKDIISGFASIKASVLVIDLRYNGGGYGPLAKEFAGLILPENFNDKLMSAIRYNDILGNGKANLLKKHILRNGSTLYDYQKQLNDNALYYFQKLGALQDVKTIYFIVSKETASASELLIHALQAYSHPLSNPYIDVKIIGKQTRGKGYGWDLPIKVNGWEVQLINSAFQNRDDQFLPQDGLNPSRTDFNISDELNYELGNLMEPCLEAALEDIIKNFK